MWKVIKRLITVNPMGVFIYGLLSKWYLLIAFTALVVTFWVLKGLQEVGFFREAQTIVFGALNDAKSIAKNCVPRLNNIEALWKCVQDPPPYIADEEEEGQVDKMVNKIINQLENEHYSDPYNDDLPLSLPHTEKSSEQHKNPPPPPYDGSHEQEGDPNIPPYNADGHEDPPPPPYEADG